MVAGGVPLPVICTLALAAWGATAIVPARRLRSSTVGAAAPPGYRTKLNVANGQKGVVVSELRNVANRQFLIEVELGGQRLHLAPDTGSFGLVVTSRRCSAAPCPARAFDPAASDTYEALNATKGALFGSGRLWMRAAQDELVLPGVGQRRQRFWEIVRFGDRMADMWETAEFEGILGLSWRSTVPSFNDTSGTIMTENTVLENFGIESFTVCLGRVEMRPYDTALVTPSRIYWSRPGALEWQAHTTYMDVVGENHWAVKLGDVSLWHVTQEKPWNIACWSEPCAAVIDLGSSALSAPHKHMRDLLTMIGNVSPDCSNFPLLPTLQLRLGGSGEAGINITLPPRVYVDRVAYSNSMASCSLRLTAHNHLVTSTGAPMWVLGQPFLQEFACEFDRLRAPARIGVSAHPGWCPPGPSGSFVGGSPPPQPGQLNSADEARALLRARAVPDVATMLGLGLVEAETSRHL